MTKDTSVCLKGLAILMMLWLHLFSCGDFGFATQMRKVCSMCVPIYIFLSGYGLYTIMQVKGYECQSSWKRILRLYINFWIVLLLAYPFGCLLNPDLFMNLQSLLLNATGICDSFNGAWWYLTPYCILVLISVPCFRWLSGASVTAEVVSGIILLVLHIVAYLLKDYIPDDTAFIPGVCKAIVNTVYLALMFMCGALYAKHDIISKFGFARKNGIAIIAILALCILKLQLGASALLHTPFVLLIIPLFATMRLNLWVKKFLMFFGVHSTNMWLCHYFFIDYIAHKEIYQLGNPLLIYTALVVLSVAASILAINPMLRLLGR